MNENEIGLDYQPDWKEEYQKAVDLHCITLDELREANFEIKRLIGVVGGMALAQPVQEPVAWMVYTQDGQSVYVTDNPTDIQEGQRALPLYTTPPQRPWAGLDHDELIERANQEECASVFCKGAIWGAARFREKNA